MESSGSAKPVQAGQRTGSLHERRRRSAPRDGEGKEGLFVNIMRAGGAPPEAVEATALLGQSVAVLHN
eukprot:2952367-Pleurochrysis_carterae.AAC.1